jgi:hypothetical protein
VRPRLRLFELVVLLARRERSKELEILVLRHELSILRRQVRRPQFATRDRLLLAVLSRVLPCDSWHAFPVTPGTLLRWHRHLVARYWTYAHTRLGRPPVDRSVRELILRLARENPRWSYVRIVGELRKLGIDVSATLVRSVLRRAWTRFPRRGRPCRISDGDPTTRAARRTHPRIRSCRHIDRVMHPTPLERALDAERGCASCG